MNRANRAECGRSAGAGRRGVGEGQGDIVALYGTLQHNSSGSLLATQYTWMVVSEIILASSK